MCVNRFIVVTHMNYQQLIKIENLFQAYAEFRRGKKKRLDLQIFERNLEDNLFSLQHKLKHKTYRHGDYEDFFVNDPKRRHIHKTNISHKILHHLLYKFLYDIFDKSFIYDSYSCRLNKGTHKGVKRLYKFTRIVSKNYSRDCFALKFDIKKFFASVNHAIVVQFLKKKIDDENILMLLKDVINSFASEQGLEKGIPLGNLTSQIFANIYLDELDQFIKHTLKIKYYIRYADDFVILSSNKNHLPKYTCILGKFIKDKLNLELHPDKVILRKLSWGIDFLGYIILPNYILPRTKTKKRLFRKVNEKIEGHKKGKISNYSLNQSIQSYLGYLSHANSYKLKTRLKVAKSWNLCLTRYG